jgi:hypothetical protein
MITRNWKIVKGTAERREGTQGTEAKYQYIGGVFDTEGNNVPYITTGCSTGTTTTYKVLFTSNETLFTSWSNSLDQTYGEYELGNTSSAGGRSKIIFGSDETPPAATDYRINQPIESGITLNERTISSVYNEETNNFETLITYRGSVSKDMIIKEVGIVKAICITTNTSGSTDSYFKKNILCTRDVLETPLDLKAGDGFRVTIKVEM